MLVSNLMREMDQIRKNFQSLVSGEDRCYHQDNYPLTNVVEKEDEFVIHSLLPGVDPKDVEITYENGILTLKGEGKKDFDDENSHYLRRERTYGPFEKRLEVSVPVEADSIKAHYQDGVLKVSIKKAEKAKPVKIKID
ncbi:MAG: heat-shock protein [bacterium]|nr:MAG: heat-shock protein [bacterium]